MLLKRVGGEWVWLLEVIGGKPIRLLEMVGEWWLARGHGVYAAWLVGEGGK